MTRTTLKTAVATLSLAAAAFGIVFATPADAGGRGKEFFSETYTFKKPMNGYEGRAGDYYCSYTKIPVRKCNANGSGCRIVAWTLEQRCY